jgi:hypothetical protein
LDVVHAGEPRVAEEDLHGVGLELVQDKLRIFRIARIPSVVQHSRVRARATDDTSSISKVARDFQFD